MTAGAIGPIQRLADRELMQGKGKATIKLAIDPADNLKVGDDFPTFLYLSKVSGGIQERVSSSIRYRSPVVEVDTFKAMFPKNVSSNLQ